MATTSHQCEHHTSSNAAEQTRFEHDKCKKLYNECKLSVRRILKTSPNLEARKLHEITRTKHVNPDSIINKIVTVDPKNTRLKRIAVKSLTRTITRKYGTISCNYTKQHHSVNHNT